MPFKGRSFDLNEATMKYLDPSMKKGVLPGLKFRALPPGKEYQTGPQPGSEKPSAPASNAPASNADDFAFLSERGAHSTVGGVNQPLGTTMGFNPELAARLAAAGRDFEASHPDVRARYGEGDRDIATQAQYWADSHHGRDYKVAPPGHSLHQGGNAMDIPYRDNKNPFWNWLREGNMDRYGINFPVKGDPPHIQMNPAYKGDNFYNPTADQQKPSEPQAAIGPNGEMIVFGGLGGQLDRESAARSAAAKGLTPKYFDYRDTEAALKYAKGLDRPYESMGFSAGVNSQERFAEEARKRGIPMPRGATAVGQYAPEGGRHKLPNNSDVPTEHYLDPSGKGLKGQVPEGNYFEGRHMPSKEDPGTMARAADAIQARIKAEKAQAAAKDLPEAARNPAAAKAKDEEPKKEAKSEK